MAEHRAGVAHNPISNLKLKSGVAPMRVAMQAGVRLALGCDNCSCGDCQSMFQAMRMFCLLAAVTDPNPTGVHATDAIRAATLGGAQAMNLEGEIGRPAGMKADLIVIDLDDVAWQPLNSVARHLVFSEAGRGVETTIVDGEIVMLERKIATIDEAALRDELASLMPTFRRNFASIAEANRPAIPYLLAANERLKSHDVGMNPGICRAMKRRPCFQRVRESPTRPRGRLVWRLSLGGGNFESFFRGKSNSRLLLGGSLGCDGPVGFERGGVGADGSADHWSTWTLNIGSSIAPSCGRISTPRGRKKGSEDQALGRSRRPEHQDPYGRSRPGMAGAVHADRRSEGRCAASRRLDRGMARRGGHGRYSL